MPRPSFSAIRQALAGLDQAALLTLIGDLFALGPQNRDFLEARFVKNAAALDRYKAIISKALYPDVYARNPAAGRVSFRDAKKAISDYKKARGDATGFVELLVYAAETGNQFTCDLGDIDEPFYNSLERMFEAAAKAVSALDAADAEPFVQRLANIVKKASGIGWGYYDAIDGILHVAFPQAGDP